RWQVRSSGVPDPRPRRQVHGLLRGDVPLRRRGRDPHADPLAEGERFRQALHHDLAPGGPRPRAPPRFPTSRSGPSGGIVSFRLNLTKKEEEAGDTSRTGNLRAIRRTEDFERLNVLRAGAVSV